MEDAAALPLRRVASLLDRLPGEVEVDAGVHRRRAKRHNPLQVAAEVRGRRAVVKALQAGDSAVEQAVEQAVRAVERRTLCLRRSMPTATV